MEPMEEEGRRGYEMRVPPIMNGAEDDGEYRVDRVYTSPRDLGAGTS